MISQFKEVLMPSERTTFVVSACQTGKQSLGSLPDRRFREAPNKLAMGSALASLDGKLHAPRQRRGGAKERTHARIPVFARSIVTAALLVLTASGCRPAGNPARNRNTTDNFAKSAAKVSPTEEERKQSERDQTVTETIPTRVAEQNEPVPGTKHRVLLFPPDGPLLFELEITVAGRPLDGWADAMLDEAFDLADGDQNGQVTWDELFESDELERRYLTDSPAIEQGLDAAKEQYDTNNNDLVDRYELPQILTGNRSTGQSFGLRSSNYYREVNRYASPLFRYLDENFDGALGSHEIISAAVRLRARDFDNDEFVALSDLSLDEANQGEMRNNAYQPHVAVWLGPKNPWDTIRLALNDLYADGDRLSAEHFPLTPKLFGTIDANGDERVSLRELAVLTQIEPHVAIRVELSSDEPSAEIFAKVTLCEALVAANVQVDNASPWLRITLPESRIDLFARSMVIQTPERQAKALLAKVDTDKNDYIDPDEYQAYEVPWESEFSELDADGNDMIFLPELTTLFAANQALSGSQVRIRVGHRPDALFSTIDTDGNQRLAPLELDQLSNALGRLDKNGDGAVTPDEVPDHLVLGLSQGGDQQANNLLANPPNATPPVSQAPDWFQSMDQNGDGQLSPREFLGQRKQFDVLDSDSNGYLSLKESQIE